MNIYWLLVFFVRLVEDKAISHKNKIGVSPLVAPSSWSFLQQKQNETIMSYLHKIYLDWSSLFQIRDPGKTAGTLCSSALGCFGSQKDKNIYPPQEKKDKFIRSSIYEKPLGCVWKLRNSSCCVLYHYIVELEPCSSKLGKSMLFFNMVILF